jgi:hypothetical protein
LFVITAACVCAAGPNGFFAMVKRKRHPYPAGCGFLGCMW